MNEISRLANDIGIDKKLIEVLIQRGYDTKDKLYAFLYPKFDDLTAFDKYIGFFDVVERINQAIDNHESILLYGDYDCDGICGVSILYNYLKSRNAEVNCFLPNRHKDGYGLNIEALEMLADRYLSDLLITIDCGITSVEEVEYAREVLGFDVIVTDHHELGKELPDCLIFNPKLSQDGAFKDLCGAGVALRLVQALGGDEQMLKYIDIATIATIADVVPLNGDNRIIAKAGLKKINSINANKGIKMLANSCINGEVSSYDIGFKIAPRINAVGRIDDANKVLDLFCIEDNFLLQNIVKDLNEYNSQRMQLTDDLTQECMSQLKGYDFENNAVIALYNAYWDDGIIGIVASRLAETFNRPTVLMTKNGDVFKGSGRSIKGINIFEYVSKCADMLVKFGGHSMAFGLAVEEKNIPQFIQKLNDLIKQDYDMSYFIPKKGYDIDIAEVENVLNMARGIKMLEPFGEGNANIRFRELVENIEFAQMGNTSHLVSKQKNKELVLFDGLKYKQFLSQKVQKIFYYKLSLQSYQNKEYAQGKISDFVSRDIEEQGDCSEYLLTGFLKGEENFEYIDYAKALSMGDKKFGVCYIAYNIDTFTAFYELYKEKYGDIIIENRKVENTIPVTKIIFCPASLKELCYYDKIILLDKPIYSKVFEKVMNKNAKLYCAQIMHNFAMLGRYLPDYGEMAKIFMCIKKVLAERKIAGVSDLYYAIANNTQIEYNKFVIAMLTFVDLGIIKYNPYFEIDSSVKTKLSESKIYAMIEAESGRTGN